MIFFVLRAQPSIKYLLTYLLYFDARPVSVQAGPPSASGCPLRVHSELDEAGHRVGP